MVELRVPDPVASALRLEPVNCAASQQPAVVLPMSIRFLSAIVLVSALALAPTILPAEALIKPVPTPDLSKLPAARADALRKVRQTFDKTKASLAGARLAEVHALLGAAYAREGFYDAAQVALEDASLLAPEDGRWVYARGVLARAQGQNAVAQNFFDLALRLDKNYLPIRITVVRSKLDNGDLTGARNLLEEYVAKHTDQAVPYAMLGEIALREKRYADAVTQTQRALALAPQATRLYATLADAQAGAGNTAAAAAARAKAGDVEPSLGDPLGVGLLGTGTSTRSGTAATAAPADPVAQHVSDAAAYMQLKQYVDARRELDSALKLRPNDASLLALYSRVEASAGNLAAARSRASAAIAADRNNALAWLSQGVALEMGGDDAGARSAYEQAARIDPKLGEARVLLGSLLMRTRRTEDAIEQYRALVRLDLNDGGAWNRLVAAYVAAGQCRNALRDTNDMLAKNIDNTVVMQLFVRVASTCRDATAEQRRGALQFGARLYKQGATAPVSESFALALAANGRWDQAVQTQQAAMFLLVRNGLKEALPAYREVLTQLQAHRVPDRPWPATAPLFNPPRLAPDAKPQAQAPPSR